MTFPVEPRSGETDARGLFPVQDPDVRSKVLPLFSFDPDGTERRPVGHGTAFRIDPWSRCLSAYHVLEDLFALDASGSGPALRPDRRLAALETEGLGFGRAAVPAGAWRPLSGSFALCAVETVSFQAPRLRNLTELVVLRIKSGREGGTPYWPLDLRRWRPAIGERVLALGYADLDHVDGEPEAGDDERPISQYLYGAIGQITDFEPADGARGRPWPVFRVAADWPGGMSGGPVFNEAGHVVGVVSSGIAGAVGTATYFWGWNMPERIIGSIDPDNPGRFLCHGVFNQQGDLALATQDAEVARSFAEERGFSDMSVVSVDPTQDGWVRVERRW